jgi:hypothetical protein
VIDNHTLNQLSSLGYKLSAYTIRHDLNRVAACVCDTHSDTHDGRCVLSVDGGTASVESPRTNLRGLTAQRVADSVSGCRDQSLA